MAQAPSPTTPRASITYPEHLVLHRYPDPVLRRQAETITVFDESLRAFCQRMFAAMERERGVGLAAPQMGVSVRLFVTDHARRKDSGAPPDPRVWINPRIEKTTGTTVYEEGCLSFPSIYAKVNRYDRFDIIWQDEWGIERRQSLDVGAGDFLGIVVQHELDHLDGIVFVDHLTPTQLTLVRGRLRDLEKDFRKATGKAGSPLRR